MATYFFWGPFLYLYTKCAHQILYASSLLVPYMEGKSRIGTAASLTLAQAFRLTVRNLARHYDILLAAKVCVCTSMSHPVTELYLQLFAYCACSGCCHRRWNVH